MKDTYNFDVYSIQSAKEIAQRIAGIRHTEELETVITVAFSDKRNLPSLRFKETEIVNLQDYINKWVGAYLNGYDNRPSQRTSKKSNTYSDAIIKIILQSRLPNISNELADKIEGGHSLLMTIENIVGDLLEEYLSIKLHACGWCCCWGSTIDAVDFCRIDGSLLQVKNSDNSENSSSSRVRAGTTIQKWYRRVSTKENTYVWERLHELVGRTDLSENDFRNFVNRIISNNPDCIFVERDHPLM